MTEWESAHDRNNREKISRARQAAEDLFKPIQQTASAEAVQPVSNAAVPSGEHARRAPRVFTTPPRAPANAQAKTPVEAKPLRRKAAPRREAGSVPSSHLGRVRALTSYGMSPAQVAELYGVSVEEIKRIINTPRYSLRSR